MSFTHRSKIICTALLLDMAHMNRYEMNTYNLFLTNFGRNDLYKLIGYSIIEIVNNALLETSTWKSILIIFSHILDFASFKLRDEILMKVLRSQCIHISTEFYPTLFSIFNNNFSVLNANHTSLIYPSFTFIVAGQMECRSSFIYAVPPKSNPSH